MKRKVCLILVCTLFLIGCWDREELKEIVTVVAIGLDKDPNTGKILFTAQIIRPGALAKEGGTQESPIEIVSSSGNTLFEAIRNSTEKIRSTLSLFPYENNCNRGGSGKRGSYAYS